MGGERERSRLCVCVCFYQKKKEKNEHSLVDGTNPWEKAGRVEVGRGGLDVLDNGEEKDPILSSAAFLDSESDGEEVESLPALIDGDRGVSLLLLVVRRSAMNFSR